MKAFKTNDFPTIGIEEEFHLIDRRTMALTRGKGIDDIRGILNPEMQERICYELMPCIIENRSGVCRDVDSLLEMVKKGRLAIHQACEKLDLLMVASGSYTGMDWREQTFVDTPHYNWMREHYFYLAKRLMAFGIHVHVGVKSEEIAFYVMHEMKRWAYPILALSANSPFYDNQDTGLDSARIHLFHSMPRTGFSPDFRSAQELEDYVAKMIEVGDIQRPGDLWWMIRPPLPLGTVEYRLCDLPTDVYTAAAITAIFQAATAYYQMLFLDGGMRSQFQEEFIDQNCWRSYKDGLDGMLVDPVTTEVISVKDQLKRLINMIGPTADELSCSHHLNHALRIIDQGNEAAKQRQLFQELNHDFSALENELANRTIQF